MDHRQMARKKCQIAWKAILLFFSVISAGRRWAGIPKKERAQDSLNQPGCRTVSQQLVQENLLVSGSDRARMECRMKGMLRGNNFTWSDRWPSFSHWSSATLASIQDQHFETVLPGSRLVKEFPQLVFLSNLVKYFEEFDLGQWQSFQWAPSGIFS